MTIPNQKKIAILLWATFSFFYLLCNGGNISTPDGTVMYRLTRAIALTGHLDLAPLAQWPDFGIKGVWDNQSQAVKYYAKFGIGLSIAAVPFFLVGHELLPLCSDKEKDIFYSPYTLIHLRNKDAGKAQATYLRALWYDPTSNNFDEAFTTFTTNWTNAFIVAGILAGIFLISIELGYSLFSALLIAILVGIATPCWHYAKEFFSEPLAGFGITWFSYFILKGGKNNSLPRNWAWAGLMFGIALMAKIIHGVLLAPVLLWLWFQSRQLHSSSRYKYFAAFGLTCGLNILLIAIYNYLRFHSIIETGYSGEVRQWETPFLKGFTGLLVSPGRGLLIYHPLIWVAFIGFYFFFKRHFHFALFIFLSSAILLVLYSRWWSWEGGWCWGPRFLIPVIPILTLPILPLLRWRSFFIKRLLLFMVFLLAFAVALSGVIVNYNEYIRFIELAHRLNQSYYLNQGIENYYPLMIWSWKFAPVLHYWDFPIKDYFLLPHAVHQPGFILSLFIIFSTLFLITLLGLITLVKKEISPLH